MTQPSSRPPRSTSKHKLYIAATVAAAIVVILAGIVFVMQQKLTPDELARQWVEAHIDATGEIIARWLTQDNTILSELGGEYIEDRIHDTIQWEYSPSTLMPNGLYQVTATAKVAFNVPPANTPVEASVPWDMQINHDSQDVTATPQWVAAQLSIPGVVRTPNLDETVDKAKKALEQAAPVLKDKTQSIRDKLK